MTSRTRAKRPRSPTPEVTDVANTPSSPAAKTKSKKLKLLAEHALASPFPDYPHPTPTEAYQVHAVLSQAHKDIRAAPTPAPKTESASDNAARTCGQVPNVLESLIGTILSQNTSGKNSTAAKHSLDQTFGRNNFQAIASADKKDVVESIKMGGLANKKAEVIQKILREVKERHGSYSLQHLAGVVKREAGVKDEEGVLFSDEEAMQELVSYDGVGPKTASCVLLFCLGRASFPVDTHVFRLSKLLGWVPNKADRVTAQAHLDLKIPNELKYGLHVLMVGHGRRCKGCQAKGKGDCALKGWLRTKDNLDDMQLEHISNEIDEKVDMERGTIKLE